MRLDGQVEQVIELIAESLQNNGSGTEWLIGGSCGLLLQEVGLTRQPRDIDLYTDEQKADLLYSRLEKYALDRLELSTTDMYSSRLARFLIQGMPVELVSGFQIKQADSIYKVNVAALLPYSPEVRLGGQVVRLMPLAHELVFNVLRHREDRYESIAARMRLFPDLFYPALGAIVKENHLDRSVLNRLHELTGESWIR
ncbi:nucleotidyltransferase domain-containing protein [Paenibacillus sp. J2TS4]|uniref:nucleotidyltransferase domain-containing protein n=1 Tax=Paenibacillus sp. J2TS4 TaxID=2807194 RepID=UPI001B20F00A|nr:hypothetical protein [Paenibacillus sp. J2TS4]GIP32380.1 hypothetical protein J2TS4_15900 [Paenibacillus sp. J2TS4]